MSVSTIPSPITTAANVAKELNTEMPTFCKKRRYIHRYGGAKLLQGNDSVC